MTVLIGSFLVFLDLNFGFFMPKPAAPTIPFTLQYIYMYGGGNQTCGYYIFFSSMEPTGELKAYNVLPNLLEIWRGLATKYNIVEDFSAFIHELTPLVKNGSR
jgi:hypothetical protein